jgi:hypothetical protein
MDGEGVSTAGSGEANGGAPSIARGIPASGRISFRALRNNATFGTHEVSFARQGDRLLVDTAIDYCVKIAFITAFRYRLRAREIWLGGKLQTVRAKTDNNGASEFMSLDRDGDGFVVEGSRLTRQATPDDRLLASHWNIAQLKGPMINPQDGSALRYRVASLGTGRIADSSGRARLATHYSLAGEHPLELWYDADDVWSALRARVFDGSVVTYSAVG